MTKRRIWGIVETEKGCCQQDGSPIEQLRDNRYFGRVRRLSLFVVILASQGNDSNKVIDRYENIDIIVLIETVNKESLHP